MNTRSVVVVTAAALIGASAPGFAQAARGDGDHRSPAPQHRVERDRGSNINGAAIALGIGLLGLAVIASQHDDAPIPQQYGYAPNYGPGYAPNYDRGYAPRHARGYAPGYPPMGNETRSIVYPNGGRGYIYPDANPMIGY